MPRKAMTVLYVYIAVRRRTRAGLRHEYPVKAFSYALGTVKGVSYALARRALRRPTDANRPWTRAYSCVRADTRKAGRIDCVTAALG